MIILREKEYSLFDSIKNIFSSNKTQKDFIEEKKKKEPVKLDYITFAEGYEKNYWPALVTFGISSDKSKSDGGWFEIAEYLKTKGMFNKGGDLIGIHELSDNIKGKNGACVVVLEFSKETDINSSVRLSYSKNFKWPEDVFCDYNTYYTWYKSGLKLFDNK